MLVKDPRTGKPATIDDGEAYLAAMEPLWAECPHEQTELRLFAVKGGQTQVRAQCLRCGAGVGNALGGIDRSTLAPADTEAADQYARQQQEARDAIAIRFIDSQGKRDGAWWAKYEIYLHSPEWRAKRDLVLARCNWTCEGCGTEVATEVHHMTYEHVFAEFLFELKGMCHGCHQRWHADDDK